MINTTDTPRQYYDASRPFRLRAIRGILHSGRLIHDPRQQNRRSL